MKIDWNKWDKMEASEAETCGGFRNCKLFIQKYNPENPDCRECYKDSMDGMMESLLKRRHNV